MRRTRFSVGDVGPFLPSNGTRHDIENVLILLHNISPFCLWQLVGCPGGGQWGMTHLLCVSP